MKRTLLNLLVGLAMTNCSAQEGAESNDVKDSLYILEVEDKLEPDKVLHAEPLFIDLMRDLGARKGEKEWNVGLGLIDNDDFDKYTSLVEYEWAPIDRLGLEVELPFTFYNTNDQENGPRNKMNSIKVAAQYTFLVSEPRRTSMALGYLHEFNLTEFHNYGTEDLFIGNLFSPFFVAAKRWGHNFHTLIYTGPKIWQYFNAPTVEMDWQVNYNFHYMITGTRNFVGMEINQLLDEDHGELILRPQMRVGIADNLLIGIVTGIPVSSTGERLSSFLRIIYEPAH